MADWALSAMDERNPGTGMVVEVKEHEQRRCQGYKGRSKAMTSQLSYIMRSQQALNHERNNPDYAPRTAGQSRQDSNVRRNIVSVQDERSSVLGTIVKREMISNEPDLRSARDVRT